MIEAWPLRILQVGLLSRCVIHEPNNNLGELTFAKKQQWAAAIAVVTLLGAIFGISHNANPPLSCAEKSIASFLVVLISLSGVRFLWSFQNHLCETRKDVATALGKKAPDPWWRGSETLFALAATLLVGGVVVGWFLWRH